MKTKKLPEKKYVAAKALATPTTPHCVSIIKLRSKCTAKINIDDTTVKKLCFAEAKTAINLRVNMNPIMPGKIIRIRYQLEIVLDLSRAYETAKYPVRATPVIITAQLNKRFKPKALADVNPVGVAEAGAEADTKDSGKRQISSPNNIARMNAPANDASRKRKAVMTAT